MKLVQQADGRWVTAPVYVGPSPVPERCLIHSWQKVSDQNIEHEADKPNGVKWMTMQTCSICRWSRVVLSEDKL